jgi:hypothetical protein
MLAADTLLRAVASRAVEIGDRPLTFHWPLVGRDFDHGVLVVGQAVFGWFGDWKANDAADPEKRSSIIFEARELFQDRLDPMDWIDGHRAWNSPFWRVARDVTDAVAPGNGPFYARMAWANLYPIAPNDVKSNPRGALLDAQTQPASAFLDAAIGAIRPRLVLVVGGPYVWPFADLLRLYELAPAGRPLYLAGRRDGVDWIVGQHPGGASRRRWGPQRYARLIADTFAAPISEVARAR